MFQGGVSYGVSDDVGRDAGRVTALFHMCFRYVSDMFHIRLVVFLWAAASRGRFSVFQNLFHIMFQVPFFR